MVWVCVQEEDRKQNLWSRHDMLTCCYMLPAAPPPCCRHIAVHPTLPYILTCSDDMLIKLWDWDKGWQCTQIFEGHSHYVMQVSGGMGCLWWVVLVLGQGLAVHPDL